MDTKNPNKEIFKPITKDQYYALEEAYAEYLKTGKTDKLCPICKESLVFIDGVTGYTITCKNSDFFITVRGL